MLDDECPGQGGKSHKNYRARDFWRAEGGDEDRRNAGHSNSYQTENLASLGGGEGAIKDSGRGRVMVGLLPLSHSDNALSQSRMDSIILGELAWRRKRSGMMMQLESGDHCSWNFVRPKLTDRQ